MPLQELLESHGHQVRWEASSAEGPPVGAVCDVVILDAEVPSCTAAVEAWRDHDPPPALLVIGRSEEAQQRAIEVRCNLVKSNASAEEVEAAVQTVLKLRFAGRMSGPYARAVLGLGPAKDAATDAIRIVTSGRQIDLELVRECLRWRAYEYVITTDLIAPLREHRALRPAELEIAALLDGTHTVQGLVSTVATDGVLAGRLLWALFSAGAVRSTREPPDERTPGRKLVAYARRHLLARRQRLASATHYDVLEVVRDANAQLVDHAARTLALRYAPARLGALDLGELAPLVGDNWQQILVARNVLMDPTLRAKYEDTIKTRRAKLVSPWAFDVPDPSIAVDFFRRGQAALVAGEALKAVSSIAGACRHHPDHPIYEAYLCWARFRAEADKGGDREELVRKERQTAETALLGRKPWPLALVALALLCSADKDPDSARFHLREALGVDPNLPVAKQLMSRLNS